MLSSLLPAGRPLFELGQNWAKDLGAIIGPCGLSSTLSRSQLQQIHAIMQSKPNKKFCPMEISGDCEIHGSRTGP